jgi:ketosteroid isomerase-like protein
MLASGIVFLASCGAPASNNAANKPANNANAANTAAPVNTAAIEADIKKLISDYAASTGKGDADAYEKMTTDNFMFVSTDGLVQTKAERVASMRSGATKYEKLTYEDVNVRVNPEGDGAVAISKATVKGMNNGKPIDDTVRVTHVWSKTKDGWKLASLQATSITAKTGPDDKKPDSAASNTANANNSVTGKNPDSATDKK